MSPLDGAPDSSEQVAVLGAGSIGVAFAIVFARSGHRVQVFDPFADALTRARVDLGDRLDLLYRHGLTPPPDAVGARVTFTTDLGGAVRGAALVQECAPERLRVKQDLFSRAARAAPGDAVLASSSSAIVPGAIAGALPDAAAARLVVGHPGNPPYLLPVVEVVPSSRTDPAVTDRARELYRAAGLRPVLVRREVEGFVFNRLQGAVLREAYCLVRDGVATVEDIDEVMRSGLGRRWSVIGPFETSDLNVRGGISAHAQRMGEAYARMGAERGQDDPWTADLVARVAAGRRAALDLADWPQRVRWRDERLMELTAIWDGAAQG